VQLGIEKKMSGCGRWSSTGTGGIPYVGEEPPETFDGTTVTFDTF